MCLSTILHTRQPVIIVTRSAFLATNSIFEGNLGGLSTSDSSCLFLRDSVASFENCTFERNINIVYNGEGGAITSSQCELRISTSIFEENEAIRGKDIFLENDLFTYLSIFKHSRTYNSTEDNFKQKVFEDNIFYSDNPADITITELQYASGKNFPVKVDSF